METRIPTYLTLMSAKSTTGVGSPQQVNDYKNVQIELTSQGSADFTAKIQGSFAETSPVFGDASSATNPWFYVASYDLSDPSSIVTGATGYSATGTDIVKGILVNTDALRWINLSITAISTGSVNAKVIGYNNH